MVALRATIPRCSILSSLTRPYGTENQASQVGERYRRSMNRFGPVVFGLIFLMITAPLTGMVSHQANSLEEKEIMAAEGWNKDIDVPTWRIGDEWVYETKFDVAQLIAQANVSASLNTLTGDTTYTVEDILFIDIDGTQTLVYKLDIDGDFTSGNNGANLDGQTGRLDISYQGEDLIRVRDLAVVNSDFTLGVDFRWLNIFKVDVADVSFDTSYAPPKEKYDFPLHTGDQWYMPFYSITVAGGSSSYFDPSEFGTQGPENNSWQVTAEGVPTDGTENIKYTGCDDSFKINEWNQTGVSQGYNWYCPAVRYNSWMTVSNAAGFTIDWMLKEYNPTDSYGVQSDSNPGTRNVEVDVDLQFLATLPNSEQIVTATYETSPDGIPQGNTNMQIRYESTNLLANPTTDGSGVVEYSLNISNGTDTTPSSDDYSSNGVIVWDPVNEIIGAATIVIDLNVVGIDLIAQSDSIIVTRTRGTDVATLNQAIGYAALPGDLLSFSIPAQNRGVLTSPATEIEVVTPDGTNIRESVPAIPSYSEQRIVVNWTVPIDAAIGDQTLSFTVDPDELVTEDANRSNNDASIDIFIGRAPTVAFSYDEGKFTFDNIILNASGSFDEDGGDVDCRFELESSPGLIEVLEAPDCVSQWNWSDDGDWMVRIIVFDEELDEDIIETNVTIRNRAPYLNLTMVESIDVETKVTIYANDSGDVDSISPPAQQVKISWPGLNCEEGLTQPKCTFIPMGEGPLEITAVAIDDDDETTTVTTTLDVLNIEPTLQYPELWYGGMNISADSNGIWTLDEDQVALLRIIGDDTLSDRDDINIEWMPSDLDPNWTVTTKGPSSTATVSWPTSGMHTIQVSAYDDDGARSEIRTSQVNILNVAPTIGGLGDAIIYEDTNISFTAEISDTASDLDTLEVCWDLNALIDSDSDMNPTNDCEIQGLNMTMMWSTQGVRQITATVMDDDGAQAMTSVNISVINIAPLVTITNSSDVTELMEGDNITLSTLISRETAGDRLTLQYDWDSDLIDSNLDGEFMGEIDFSGAEYTITNLEPGQWTFTLTVTDDNGEKDTDTITLTVREKPAEGFVESVSAVLGSAPTAIIGGLAVIVVILAVFLLLTRKRGGNEEEKYSAFGTLPSVDPPAVAQNQYATTEQTYTTQTDAAQVQTEMYAQPVQAADPNAQTYDAYQAPAQTQSASDALAALGAFSEPAVQQPAEPVAVQPAVIQPQPTGPALPASGLPEGWTMEQWQHYGEQYLAAQMGQQAPAQPTTTNTPSTSASTDMSGFLDDLDL